MLIFSPNASGLCVGNLINGVFIWTHLVVISNYDAAVCALDSKLTAFTMTLMNWKTLPSLHHLYYLDFLKKSSSRGGPRVPRPLLLVKVTVAAAARSAPLASHPKFTRYSFLHSRLSKNVTRTPLFGPPFFRLSADSWTTRDNSLSRV